MQSEVREAVMKIANIMQLATAVKPSEADRKDLQSVLCSVPCIRTSAYTDRINANCLLIHSFIPVNFEYVNILLHM